MNGYVVIETVKYCRHGKWKYERQGGQMKALLFGLWEEHDYAQYKLKEITKQSSENIFSTLQCKTEIHALCDLQNTCKQTFQNPQDRRTSPVKFC